MQTTFNFFFSLLLCLGLFLVSGCGGQGASSGTPSGGGGDPALVGKWTHDLNPDDEFLELLEDGTGTHPLGFGITWKAENGQLHIFEKPSGELVESWDYMISGSRLTIQAADAGPYSGGPGSFTKQQ